MSPGDSEAPLGLIEARARASRVEAGTGAVPALGELSGGVRRFFDVLSFTVLFWGPVLGLGPGCWLESRRRSEMGPRSLGKAFVPSPESHLRYPFTQGFNLL